MTIACRHENPHLHHAEQEGVPMGLCPFCEALVRADLFMSRTDYLEAADEADRRAEMARRFETEHACRGDSGL